MRKAAAVAGGSGRGGVGGGGAEGSGAQEHYSKKGTKQSVKLIVKVKWDDFETVSISYRSRSVVEYKTYLVLYTVHSKVVAGCTQNNCYLSKIKIIYIHGVLNLEGEFICKQKFSCRCAGSR